jgi:two-component system sensor histidine kinase KdpD
LLDLSRIEGGALRPEKDWDDVRELLEGVRDSLAPMLSHHRLIATVMPDVGDAPFDHLQLSQVLSNLVENATKFAPRGSEIRVAACRDGGMLELRVTDQGPGIPADERVQIFETFYRSPHTGVRVSGTGLGLAIAKGLVEAHDGSIRVEEAAGGGACFIVRLPAPPPPVSVLAAMDRETP